MKANVLAKWFNAITDAWNDGWADWAYVEGRSAAVAAWVAGGDDAVMKLAEEHGVTLKRRRP